MGLIRKELEVLGDKGQIRSRVVFDTGASLSLIRRDVADRIATILTRPRGLVFVLGDGQSRVSTREAALLDLLIEDKAIWGTFWIVDALADEVIVGADFLQRWKIKLDPEREELIIDPKALELWLL